MSFPANAPVLTAEEVSGEDHGLDGKIVKAVNRWHPLDELSRVALFPAFLRTGLGNLPPDTK
jgi:hypothetical protein